LHKLLQQPLTSRSSVQSAVAQHPLALCSANSKVSSLTPRAQFSHRPVSHSPPAHSHSGLSGSLRASGSAGVLQQAPSAPCLLLAGSGPQDRASSAQSSVHPSIPPSIAPVAARHRVPARQPRYITLTSAGSSSEPECPTFVGGDRVTTNEDLGSDECFYFYTNSIEATQYKGSNEDYEQYYVFGKPSYVENCSGSTAGAGNLTATPATQPPTTETPGSINEDPETETPWTEAPTATPTSTEYPTSAPEASSTGSSVAGDASDASSDGDYPAGTVAPGGCKGKKRSWTRG